MQIIKEPRKKENMTQKELAERLGVSVYTVRNYKNKTKMVPTPALIKFADIFLVSPDYLLEQDFESVLSIYHRLSPEMQRLLGELIRYMK